MCKILLDIGGGGSSFVNKLRNNNYSIDILCLIGEPEYKKLWDGKVPWWQRTKKIQASYHDFGIRSNSLDFVTLNAPFPFESLNSLGGLNEELIRCLKKGGYFISAHPVGWHPEINTTFFREVGKDGRLSYFSRLNKWFGHCEAVLNLAGYGRINYPASPTIRDRLKVLESRTLFEDLRFSASYIYAGMRNYPSVRVWQRLLD